MTPSDPLHAKLVVVTGKGGVGKTTVAAALGLAAARAGRRTLVCEVAGQARLPALFGVRASPRGTESQLADGLWTLSIDPAAALAEWLGQHLPHRAAQLLARSGTFGAFVAAAPGARGARVDHQGVGARRRPALGPGGAALRLRDPRRAGLRPRRRDAAHAADVRRHRPGRPDRRARRDRSSRAWPSGAAPPTSWWRSRRSSPVSETLELEERLTSAVRRDVDAIVVQRRPAAALRRRGERAHGTRRRPRRPGGPRGHRSCAGAARAARPAAPPRARAGHHPPVPLRHGAGAGGRGRAVGAPGTLGRPTDGDGHDHRRGRAREPCVDVPSGERRYVWTRAH